MDYQKLLTPHEVANILGVTVQTLAVWRCDGRYELPFVKAGRLVRYRKTDIDEFITARTRVWG